MSFRPVAALILALSTALPVFANPPVASYIFPAGGQRGTTVDVKVGGLFLHSKCYFEMLGPGVEAGSQLQPTRTLWLEGPLLPLPDSQQAEDYPKDMAGRVKVAADAELGLRYWRLATAQGATPAMKFVVGDLPELIETEVEGDPIPVEVNLPVTVNGRIFPREDVDIWTVELHKGQSIVCEVCAARLGAPLDSHLEVLDAQGRALAENDDALDADSFLRFTAPADGKYQVCIHDMSFKGGQAYVYRLTLTTGPYVERVYPLGGRRGSRTEFELTGQGLPTATVPIELPAGGPAGYWHRLQLSGGATNPFPLDLDDLPDYREAEPNDAPTEVKPVAWPAVCNGRIDRPGDADCWAIDARKGEPLELAVRAAQLGSPLRAVLTISDAAGKELARAEPGKDGTDPVLRFAPPVDGTFHVRIEDRFRSRGGPAYAYRLRLAASPKPDFRLQLTSDALTVNQGGEVKLKISVERIGGFDQAITLQVDGLPEGVTATGTTIAAGAAGVDLTLKADAAAPIRPSRLTVRGTARIGDATVTRTAERPETSKLMPVAQPVDSVLLAVALPTPFKIVGDYDMRWAARGTVHLRRYRIERGGYDGPIQVLLADRQARHLQGVTGPTITVPPGATEFDYPIHLPPWMETGRTCRVCVMGVAAVKNADGSEHEVSFSSVNQNEQLVAVIEPGRLSIETTPASVRAAPGKTISLTVKVARGQGLNRPVKLELVIPAHIRGISAESIELAADQTDVMLPLRFAEEIGPFNAPLTLRATTLDGDRPVIAEAKVAIQSPDR